MRARGHALAAFTAALAFSAVPASAERPEGVIFWPARLDFPPTPWGGVMLDVTGDDRLDYVFIDGLPGASVLRGTGEAFFEAEPYRSFPTAAHRVILADIDADGRDDLVFIEGQPSVDVVLAGPDGSFPEVVATPLTPADQLLVAKMDGDPFPDILLVGYGDYFIHHGRGDGTFGPAVPVVGAVARDQGWGDPELIAVNLDGDAHTDIVHGSHVVLRSAAGVTQTTLDVPLPSYPASMAFGDFDEDGLVDLVIAESTDLTIARGTGVATFADREVVHAHSGAGDLDAVDLDADGHLDLVVGETRCLDCPINVSRGHGDGTFDAPKRLAVTEFGSYQRFTVDVNGDGRLDVASWSYVLSVFYGTPDGVLGDGVHVPVGGHPARHAVTELTSDGVADIVIVTGAWPVPLSHVSVWRGTGDASFVEVHRREMPPFLYLPPLVADVDGDGLKDVVCGGGDQENEIRVFRGLGGGILKPHAVQTLPDGTIEDWRIADVGGDGIVDLVASGQRFVTPSHGEPVIAVLTGRGDGTFEPAAYHATDHWPQIDVGDLDQDGRDDVAIGDHTSRAVRFGQPDGSLGPRVETGDTRRSQCLRIADYSGDGIPDIAFSSRLVITLLIGKGGGLFNPPHDEPVGEGLEPGRLVAADVTRDGRPDLITEMNEGSVAVFVNAGDGTFVRNPYGYGTVRWHADVQAIDADGDGDTDLSTLDFFTRGVKLLMNVGDEPVPIDTDGIDGSGVGPSVARTALSATPNPFSSVLRVGYVLPADATVTLTVYDVAGRRVRTLLGAARATAGVHAVTWDGRSDSGRAIAPGVYFVRMRAPGVTAVERLVRLP